ncbi:MAG: Ldh family oxidoreductase [Planctomycetaceae bacterium]
MPSFTVEQLLVLSTQILRGAGVRAEDADVVAKELTEANLVGHDSHGVMRLMQYVDYIDKGFIRPDAGFSLVNESPAFAVVDGQFHFGQVTATRALRLGLEKARASGTATIFARNCNHVGRLGSYAHQAAVQGFAAAMCVNAPGPGGVAPYGGIEQRLGTNPIAMSAPRGDEPLVLDMTSSATAEGKLRVAFQKGEQVPLGWIIDCEGRPSTDPAVFYADPPGAILPLGGPLGFKGFGLSVMIDVFGGMLSGSGVCRSDLPRGANGVWMSLLHVEQLIPRDEYDALMDRYVAHLKNCRCLPGVEEILLPGEIETRRARERTRSGIPVPDETWRQLRELAARFDVSIEER